MNYRKFKFNIILFVATLLLLSACSTMHKVEGLSDYSQVELQVGDKVKAKMKDGTSIELTIKSLDTKYFYGKDDLKIKRNEIKSLEFSRFDSTMFSISLIGFAIFAVLFSG